MPLEKGSSQKTVSANIRTEIATTIASIERKASAFAEHCPMCNGTDTFLCPDCRRPIAMHTHEQDYLCDCTPGVDVCDSTVVSRLRCVSPIRLSDGAQVIGDGVARADVLTR